MNEATVAVRSHAPRSISESCQIVIVRMIETITVVRSYGQENKSELCEIVRARMNKTTAAIRIHALKIRMNYVR